MVRKLLPFTCTALVVATACKRPDDVPEDADGAAAWLYEHQPNGEPDDVTEALRNLRDALELDAMAEPMKGLLLPLTASAVQSVGLDVVELLPESEQEAISDDDLNAGGLVRLADQQGLLVASVIPCDVEDVVATHVRLDQDAIHGGYDAYLRQYTSDFSAFEAGTTPTLSWQTDYTVSVIGSRYDATILGGVRWVDLTDGTRMGHGRAHLPEPGVFTRGGGYFRQDYHLDLFYEHAPGETMHVLIVWRDLRVAGIHSSNAAFISTVSNRFLESDETIAEVCAGS
jgi:hypothetical protein